MASRNYAQVAPTAATIALNAYIYGYGGHSLVTPHAALKQLWWTSARIEAKITRAFVLSKLRGEEREFLDKPLAFGEGLTDDTYMEWILDRSKRLFLILTELGVPDQIFGCIDDSWDDEDLPVPLENVKNLELSFEDDEALNKKFYDMQFVYLLRELTEGSHIDYGNKEHIPMEHVNVMPPAVTLQPYDRVHFPGRPEEVYMRRKYALTNRDNGSSYHEKYTRDVRQAKALEHEHIARCWASYTAESAGFILSDFVAEHTLGTFIDHRTPMQFMRVAASERPILLCEWMHCLADALASLHHRGVAHTAIRPSNIWITKENKIAFSDVGSLGTFQRNKKAPKTEIYDYAPPESQSSKTPVTLRSSVPPASSMSAFSRLRKMSSMSTSSSNSSSSGGSSTGSSTRSNSICTATIGTPIGSPIGSPITPASSDGRSDSLTTLNTALSSTSLGGPRSPTSTRNFSRHLAMTCPSPSTPFSPLSPTSQASFLLPRPSTVDPNSLCDLPAAAPEMSDIWSLGCIFLDFLTFMVKGKNNEFVKYRTTRVNTPGKKTFRTDSSFHYEPDKISTWIIMLEDESLRQTDPIFRGVPELLGLVRRMMSQNATLRPTALEVRDKIQDVLVGECGVEALCCAGREWPEASKNQLQDDESTRSPYKREKYRDAGLSITTGLLDVPLRKASDASRFQNGSGAADGMSVVSKTESGMTATRGRRTSSASTATAKLNSWRARIFTTGT